MSLFKSKRTGNIGQWKEGSSFLEWRYDGNFPGAGYTRVSQCIRNPIEELEPYDSDMTEAEIGAYNKRIDTELREKEERERPIREQQNRERWERLTKHLTQDDIQFIVSYCQPRF